MLSRNRVPPAEVFRAARDLMAMPTPPVAGKVEVGRGKLGTWFYRFVDPAGNTLANFTITEKPDSSERYLQFTGGPVHSSPELLGLIIKAVFEKHGVTVEDIEADLKSWEY